jgi:hypothetical protein
MKTNLEEMHAPQPRPADGCASVDGGAKVFRSVFIVAATPGRGGLGSNVTRQQAAELHEQNKKEASKSTSTCAAKPTRG